MRGKRNKRKKKKDVVVHLRDRPFHQTMMMGGKGVKEEDGTAMREDTINDIIIRKDQDHDHHPIVDVIVVIIVVIVMNEEVEIEEGRIIIMMMASTYIVYSAKTCGFQSKWFMLDVVTIR